jgi:hypothetical protein
LQTPEAQVEPTAQSPPLLVLQTDGLPVADCPEGHWHELSLCRQVEPSGESQKQKVEPAPSVVAPETQAVHDGRPFDE